MYVQLPTQITGGRKVYVDSRIAGEVAILCQQFGVSAYSGRRFEPGSDHNCGAAVDFVGPNSNQRALYDAAKTNKSWWVEPWISSHTIGVSGTTGPHVHISFFHCGQMPPNSPGVVKPLPNAQRLSFSQIEQVWEMGGGSRKLSPIMAGIALAESGGDPKDHCLNCAGVPEDSRGLWQINVNPNANPQFKTWNLYDPVTNATAANDVLHSQGLGAWTTYKNGEWKSHVPKGTKLPPFIPPGTYGTTSIFGGITGAVGGFFNDINPLNPIERGLTYVAQEIMYATIIMGGTIVALIGLIMIGVDIGFVRHDKTMMVLESAPIPTPLKPSYRRGVQVGKRAERRSKGYYKIKAKSNPDATPKAQVPDYAKIGAEQRVKRDALYSVQKVERRRKRAAAQPRLGGKFAKKVVSE